MDFNIMLFSTKGELKKYLETSLQHYRPVMTNASVNNNTVTYRCLSNNPRIEVLAIASKPIELTSKTKHSFIINTEFCKKLKIIEYLRDTHIVNKVLVSNYK